MTPYILMLQIIWIYAYVSSSTFIWSQSSWVTPKLQSASEGVGPQIRGGSWEQTYPSLKHKRLLQLTNKFAEEVHSHIQQKTFECFIMVLKESNDNVLSTGHINQFLFVCCFGTRIAQEKLYDPSIHGKTTILTLPFQQNWRWLKLVILVPVLCGVTPCMEHCCQANLQAYYRTLLMREIPLG